MFLLLLKKTITLLALIEPFAVVPLYLATVKGQSEALQKRYAQALALTVTIVLLVSGFIGVQLLSLLGVSLDGMRVGGGIITLILAIAMVVGHEKAVKQSPFDETAAIEGQGHSVVPLGIPLLTGPATMAYMMVNSHTQSAADVVAILVPSLLCGIVVWAVFMTSRRAQPYLTPSALSIVERVAGFLLAGIAIELIAAGLIGLFPVLKGAS
jgi:multiple antibiotic resistance protein